MSAAMESDRLFMIANQHKIKHTENLEDEDDDDFNDCSWFVF